MPDQQPDSVTSRDITKFTAQRNSAGEGSCAEDQRVWFTDEAFGDLDDIAWVVLAIGVRCDYSYLIREAAQRIIDAGLQCGTLTEIDCMTEHVHAWEYFQAIETGVKLRSAAIVHHNNSQKVQMGK